MKTGNLSQDEYIGHIKNMLERDTKVIGFYKNKNMSHCANYMTSKIAFFTKEIDEYNTANAM